MSRSLNSGQELFFDEMMQVVLIFTIGSLIEKVLYCGT